MRAFVFDLDGVIRHWPPGIMEAAERDHGLPPGILARTAFAPELLGAVTTGEISDETWRQQIARQLLPDYPQAEAAVASWSRPFGELIPGTPGVLERARSMGTVALLSNATSRLLCDLAALGISDHFDLIFNSSQIGHAKPDPAVYIHVEHRLQLESRSITYFDDAEHNVTAARMRGWNAILVSPDRPLTSVFDRALGNL